MVSSLGGGSFSSIVWVSFDSEGFEESAAIFIMVGELFLVFAMLFECFLGPSFEVPGVLGAWIVGIGVDYGVEESFLQSFLEEFYGPYVIEWKSSISGESFEVAYIGVEVFSVLQASDFSLRISGLVSIGIGLSEVCFEEVPKLLVVVLVASIDSVVEEVKLILLPWIYCVTSHVCESCSDARVWVGHGFIVTIGCSEEIESDEESCTLGASSIEWGGCIAFEGSVDINVGRLRCLLRLLLPCWLSLLLLLLLLRLLLRLLELLSD